MKVSQGFTLIELLIVIAIVAIMSRVTITILEDARVAARDASRIQKIDQLQMALELYFADNGTYPQIQHGLGLPSDCANDVDGESYEETWGHCSRWKILSNELAPYIHLDPANYTEPRQGLYHFNYTSQSDDWEKYGLEVRMEGNFDLARSDGGVRDQWYEVGQNPSYCVQNYTGNDQKWLQKSGVFNQVCKGGN